MNNVHPLILHIPHDSTIIPDQYRNDFLLSNDELASEIIAMTDMHTKELYDYANAYHIVFPVSRLLLDPERFADDSQEVMAERGMGVLYTVTSQLQLMRYPVQGEKRTALLDEYYYPHHERLTQATKLALDTHGKALIIDCHSFPSRPLPYEMNNNNALRAQICIGTDSYHTPDWVRDMLVGFFKEKGMSVAVNDPFAGALTPMDYYHQNKNVVSVMFEVRRDLYMNEQTGVKNENFNSVKKMVFDAIHQLNTQFMS